MPLAAITHTQRKTVRAAGLIYLLLVVVSVVTYLYLPSTYLVSGDAAATVSKITSSETLFRAGILGGLLNQIIFVFLALALYRALKGAGQGTAMMMVALVVISASLGFLNEFNKVAALIALSGADFLSAFEKPELESLAYFFLRLHSHGLQAIQIFWGLWLFPFGLLVYKSGFIPRILGVLLIVAGLAYVVSSVVSVMLPQHYSAVVSIAPYFEIGEPLVLLWLLFQGLNVRALFKGRGR